MSEENPKPQKEQRPPGGGDPQLNWRGLVLFAVALALIGGAFLFRGGNFTQTEEISNKQFLESPEGRKNRLDRTAARRNRRGRGPQYSVDLGILQT